MATQTKINNDWKVRGRCRKNDKPGPSAGEMITIPDSPRCIPSMPESSGIPVNAELALRFIKTFNTHYAVGPRLTPVPQLAGPFITSKVERAEVNAELEEVWNKGHHEARKHHRNALVKLKRVVDLSHGMTFDRDIILKILSQSGCEGIRLYLCARPNHHVSLVVVGVDDEGCDHRYKPIEIEKTRPLTNNPNDPSIPDNSLIGEYSTPPPSSKAKVLTDPHYALSYMANKLPD